jgi:heat shock protein HtpX
MTPLARKAALTLGLLFGLMFAVGLGLMWYLRAPMYLALFFAIVIVVAQYLVAPLIVDWIFTIRWADPVEISPEFATWYFDTCNDANIGAPRFGIIEDGNPNAFTYGRTRADARMVVTSGLVKMLTFEELKAVVAHEIGHVRNRDFIVMTVAQAVPLVLYVLYVWTRDRARGNYAFVVSIGAYLVYLLSQYLVLSLSRVRELFADERSAQTTKDPNNLSSALIKICYGLWSEQERLAQERLQASQASGGKKKKKSGLRPYLATTGVATLGIASVKSASAFALSAADGSGTFSASAMSNAMQWELNNPWATWFQLNSTHPLTARRILAMNEAAKGLGVSPAYSLAETPPARYSGSFVMEFAIYALPVLVTLLAIGFGATRHATPSWSDLTGYALIGFGVGWFIKNALIYPRLDGGVRTVENLVSEMNVSPVSAVPCTVEGQIIGRGTPGAFWSHNLVLRDSTGLIRLQYRQPLGVMEFLFGWLKAGRFINRPARVVGWYRRAPVPYIEISRVEIMDSMRGSARCYYHAAAFFLSIAIAVIGFCLAR